MYSFVKQKHFFHIFPQIILDMDYSKTSIINFSECEMSSACGDAGVKGATLFSFLPGPGCRRKYVNEAVCRRAGVIYIALAGQGSSWSKGEVGEVCLLVWIQMWAPVPLAFET